MNKLSKEKRDQFILVILVTLMALCGLYFGLIRYQYAYLADLTVRKQDAEKKDGAVETAVKHAGQLKADLATQSAELAALEAHMATGGDHNFWVNQTIRSFKQPFADKVDVPPPSPPLPDDGKFPLLPDLQYKEEYFTLQGTGYFHDLGRFLAEFENQFPYFRVLNLEIHPVTSAFISEKGDKAEKEKLEFSAVVVILVKPNPS